MFRLLRLFALVLALGVPGLFCAAAVESATGDFLEADQAFVSSARVIDAAALEVRIRIADGYYLYGNKFKFMADNGVLLGDAVFPAAEPNPNGHFDKTVFRGDLLIRLPVTAGKPPFTLTTRFQGCADAGLCYPPQNRKTLIEPAGGTSTTAPAAPSQPPVVAGDEAGQIGAMLKGGSLVLTLFSFLGFGLLLAFTPCVFPMIPILSGIIVGHGESITKWRAFSLSLAYVLGMAVTYTLAGVAAGLSGTLLSAALQNAWVLGGFGLVFVALSFSMFGFYELQLPAALQSRFSDSAGRHGGSFAGIILMGALSALIVGPCVAAPLAGALLYIAQTGDAVLGGAALFCMALGMGAPLIAVGVAARSVLPKAGKWMEGVKKAFGVILLGVALWLTAPVLPPLAIMLALAALLFISGIFLHALDPLPPTASGWQRFWKGAGGMAVITGAAILIGALAGSRDPLQPLAFVQAAQTAEAGHGTSFERVASVAELETRVRTADRPVLVDFYADWCVSCKEMERLTFTDPGVREKMARMLLLQVDVTANNDEDAALLKRFQLFGPPGIVFLEPGDARRERGRVVGFQDAERFGQSLDLALGG